MVSVAQEDHRARVLEFAESFQEALEFTSEFTPEAFPNFVKHLDPVWIEEALASTGTATVRRRRLPAEQAVWLVIAMALMRDRPVSDIVEKLGLAVPTAHGERTIAPSALVQARQRLGEEPMEWLFLRTAAEWAPPTVDKDRWRGLGLYALDGTSLRVADSEENRRHFGSHYGPDHEVGGYPLIRMVALMAVRSHLVVSAVYGPYQIDERVYAQQLWDDVPDNSLILVDRHHLQSDVLVPIMMTGIERHWLTRSKTQTKLTHHRRLGEGDDLVYLQVSREARKAHPDWPQSILVRAIRYQRKGFSPQLLLTSLVDEKRFPADEIRGLYHERWEIELGFGEIKTDMLNRLETIRSKTPAAVVQETWGILIAYNLVRLEMQRIADELGVPPTRISFVAALRTIVDEWHWSAITRTPGGIPKRLATMRDRIRRYLLPERRERSYPRAVKLKMSKFLRKRPQTSENVN
jgi:hypothetical protein